MRDTPLPPIFAQYQFRPNLGCFTLIRPRVSTACASSLHRYEWVEHGEGKGTALWGPISQWDTSYVKDMQRSFSTSRNSGGKLCAGCHAKAASFNADVSEWITSAVTDMGALFENAQTFAGSLAKWDVRQVTSMYRTFHGAGQWNGDISKWNVAEVC